MFDRIISAFDQGEKKIKKFNLNRTSTLLNFPNIPIKNMKSTCRDAKLLYRLHLHPQIIDSYYQEQQM